MKQDRKAYDFGGRIKPKEPKVDRAKLVALPHKRMAFVYQRLSTYEQTKKSIYSIVMQDALADLAKEDGYSEDQIHVEKRDLGISGTLGQDKREGLAYLIHLMESDKVESIYVVHMSRLFRDQTLIDGLSFGELCKKKNVIIVMPNMRLNLRDKMHMRIYRIELERAADELEMMKHRLGVPRHFKGKQGLFAGGNVPLGYILDNDKEGDTYQKYVPYEPHAKVVRVIFEQMYASRGSPRAVVEYCRQNGIYIEVFPQEIEAFMKGKYQRNPRTLTEYGHRVTESMVYVVTTNPAYIGWWIWAGEVVRKDNHEPIVDEELFWAVQELHMSKEPKRRGKISNTAVAVLSGLLYCVDHPEPLYVTTSFDRASGHHYYRCRKQYLRAKSNKGCFAVIDYMLEDPISEFVAQQCSYSAYAGEVLGELENDLANAKEKAEAYKREYERVSREIENLKANLALTKRPDQVKMIMDMVDERIAELDRLTKLESKPVGRILSESDVQSVKKILANINDYWDSYPNEIKNEFLRIILDRVLVKVEDTQITATVVWRGGLEQTIRIHTPFATRGVRRYTAKEDQILREMYPKALRSEILAALPGRSWKSIGHRASKLGLSRPIELGIRISAKKRYWTEEEDDILRSYYAGKITRQEAKKLLLGRTDNAMNRRASRLSLSWSRRNMAKTHLWYEVIDDGAGEKGGNYWQNLMCSRRGAAIAHRPQGRRG